MQAEDAFRIKGPLAPSMGGSDLSLPRWKTDLDRIGYAIIDNVGAPELGAQLGRASAAELIIPGEGRTERRRSLSREFGFGCFPWHTDGAVSVRPPRWVILTAMEVSTTTATE